MDLLKETTFLSLFGLFFLLCFFPNIKLGYLFAVENCLTFGQDHSPPIKLYTIQHPVVRSCFDHWEI